MARIPTGPVNIEIPLLDFNSLNWKTAEAIQQSLSQIYQYTEASANASINWYGKYKSSKSKMSRVLTVMAILFTT
jgi:hypothetical protein